MTTKPKRVAIYIRVSTKEQAEEGFSLDAQRNVLTKWCEDHGYVIVEVYKDEGISAKDIKHRKDMGRLLADARKELFDIVLVWKLTRFTRSLSDLCTTCDMLEQHGVAFVSYSESFDCTTPTGRMIRNILGVIAQFEREVISENVKAAMEERAMQGHHTCADVLGYDFVKDSTGNKKLMINRREAKIVRHIYDEFLRSKSYTEAAKSCAALGYLGKRGRALKPGGILVILTRCIYAGYNSWKRQPIKGDAEPIISIETYNAVQRAILDQDGYTGRKRKHPLVLLPEE